MSSAETGPSALNSASSTARADADTRWPLSRSAATTWLASSNSSAGRSGACALAQALLDAAEPPHPEGDRPGEGEQRDDRIADQVQVDLAHAECSEKLNRADQQRDRDRQARDR